MFHDVYCRRRVLVTGHTGFKGSWLFLWLRFLGAHFQGYALPHPSALSAANAPRGAGRDAHDLEDDADILDFPRLREFVATRQPEIVFHLAAQPLVITSYQKPRETYETNVKRYFYQRCL